MKTLTANALTEIAKQFGTEPLNILAVYWADGSPVFYADKNVDNIPGKILSLSEIETSITLKSQNSSTCTVTLTDTDGTIKAIIDTKDVHKRKCILYQYFGDLQVGDKFTIFKGEISSPFIWNEGDRTVTFTVLSQIEDMEIGFSPEEGQFDFVSEEAIGKPWPLAFGNVIHVPAVKVTNDIVGTTETDFCIIDDLLDYKISLLNNALAIQKMVLQFWQAVTNAADAIAAPAADVLLEYINIIHEEDAAVNALFVLEDEINRLKNRRAEFAPGEPDRAAADFLLISRQQFLDIGSVALANIQFRKAAIEAEARMVFYEHSVKRESYSRQLDALKAMYELMQQIHQLKVQYCKHSLCNTGNQIRITNGHKFPQGVPLRLVCNGVVFSGTMNGNIFTGTMVGPNFGGVQVARDDTIVCDKAPVNAFKGDPSLVGWYCLVTDHDGQKHVVKVSGATADGLLTFDLVERNPAYYPENANDSVINLNVPVNPQDLDIDQSDVIRICNQLNAQVTALLVGANPLNDEEYKLLLSLQCVADKEAQDSLVQPNVSLSDEDPSTHFTVIGSSIASIDSFSPVPLRGWFEGNNNIPLEELPPVTSFKINPGSEVRLESDCEIYICNILPSTIKSVYAYRVVDGIKVFSPVPSVYYTKNENKEIGPLNVTLLRFKRPLRQLDNQNWEDDIYVTMTSSVGPNVVDILQYLIETYTTKTIDAASFAAVKAKFQDGSDELYPANFALLGRQNVTEVINEIADQARCALFETNDTIYIKYLAETPVSVATITESDVKISTLQLTFDDTESIVTRLIANWRRDYSPETEANQVVLRHNVAKYGVQTSERDYYIYNIKEMVEKSATFHLIRLANTWKKVTFQTFLKNLRLEVLDCVTLDFNDNYFSNAPIKALVERVTYDTNDNLISLSLWLPVRFGEMTEYPFAWPATASETLSFPTDLEIQEGLAGGSGIGTNIVGPIEICDG